MSLTRHHLIPRTLHRNKRTRRRYELAELRSRVIWLCRPCHNHVHDVLDEKSLEAACNTAEALRSHPEIAKFVAWIRSKPAGFKAKGKRRARR